MINLTIVFSGKSYTIYSDNNYQNIWSSGNNLRGSCVISHYHKKVEQLIPITFFKNNTIKIQQIFINPTGYGSFFTTLDNKLYVLDTTHGTNIS